LRQGDVQQLVEEHFLLEASTQSFINFDLGRLGVGPAVNIVTSKFLLNDWYSAGWHDGLFSCLADGITDVSRLEATGSDMLEEPKYTQSFFCAYTLRIFCNLLKFLFFNGFFI